MIRKITLKNVLIIINLFLFVFIQTYCNAQTITFSSIDDETTTANTGEKPQSKIWQYDNKWFAVFPNSSGTYIWELSDDEWVEDFKISDETDSKADCRDVSDVSHILLFQGNSSEFISVQYNSGSGDYELLDPGVTSTSVSFGSSVEIATIEMDGVGTLWMTYEQSGNVLVRSSTSPYTSWSTPTSLENGLFGDDISAIIKMDGKIGVLWSNQNDDMYGFRTHIDGDPQTTWTADEIPASQSSQAVGGGMSDDHLNMKFASDGTLYCAVKTSYDTNGYPQIALLIRRPNGTWDDLYDIAGSGTRPIVIVDETNNRLQVVYTESDSGGDIIYRESSLSNISFGPETVMINGPGLNNASSSKSTYNCNTIVIASTSSSVRGVRVNCTATGTNLIEASGSDLYIKDIDKGVILKSPDGSCWKITVDNDGNIISTSITCPG